MHRALVYSIPGTAARFTMKFLDECLGYDLTTVESMLDAPVDAAVYAHLHVGERDDRLRMLAGRRDVKTIIPLRPPAKQHLNRCYGAKDAERKTIMVWMLLKKTMPLFDYQLLPVEADRDRRQMLRDVADHLGAGPIQPKLEQYADEWRKIGERAVKTIDKHIDTSFLWVETEWYEQQLVEYGVAA